MRGGEGEVAGVCWRFSGVQGRARSVGERRCCVCEAMLKAQMQGVALEWFCIH